MPSPPDNPYITPRYTQWHSAEILASPSKSYSHRAFIIAMLAEGITEVTNILDQGDVAATIQFCKLMGAKIEAIDPILRSYRIIGPKELVPPAEPIDCSNSGTSIRIIAALSAVCQSQITLYGEFFRRNRPMDPLLDALSQIGVSSEKFEFNGSPALKLIPNNIIPRDITIRGDISSQFITGLLIMLPLLEITSELHEIKIKIIGELKSASYIDITTEMMQRFGVSVFREVDTKDNQIFFRVPLGQKYRAGDVSIPGDFSSAAFPLSLAAIKASLFDFHSESRPIMIKNLDLSNPQPDKEIINILKKMGADIRIDDNCISIYPGRKLIAIEIDGSQIPDLFPILATISLFCIGKTIIKNAEHVRIKETDRIALMVRELTKLGAKITEKSDGIIVDGPQNLRGGFISHDEDHRIAMALAVAGAFVQEGESFVSVPFIHVVADSYPDFIRDFESIV